MCFSPYHQLLIKYLDLELLWERTLHMALTFFPYEAHSFSDYSFYKTPGTSLRFVGTRNIGGCEGVRVEVGEG